ncbi:MAG: hypothetical protein AAF371_17130 [Pseudomonadota bacterium]
MPKKTLTGTDLGSGRFTADSFEFRISGTDLGSGRFQDGDTDYGGPDTEGGGGSNGLIVENDPTTGFDAGEDSFLF